MLKTPNVTSLSLKDFMSLANRFEEIYNNSPEMYASISPVSGKILQCNATLMTKTGYLKEEIINKNVLEIYHQDSLDEARKSFQLFKNFGMVKNHKLILKKKCGGKLSVLLNTEAIRDRSGRIMYSSSCWTDISHLTLIDKNQLNKEALYEKEYNKLSKENIRLKYLLTVYKKRFGELDMLLNKDLKMI